MALRIRTEPSRTLSEYRILPGFTDRHQAVDRVSLQTRLCVEDPARGRPGLDLEIPILSAAMQSVTGPALALALSEAGGLGVIFCSQTPQDQAFMVAEVKRGGVTGGHRTPPRVAAAINTHDHAERVPALVQAGVDLLVIDASDGFSAFQADTLEWVGHAFPHVPVMGGNIVTAPAFRFLAQAGACAVKVGMGSGSICITQEQKGTGRGLATALIEVVQARDMHFREQGRYLPVVADGGIGTARDMVLALAIGADSVMLGRYFACLDESAAEKFQESGRFYKPYWGEGSARARQWRQARYHQVLFEEGVDARVECAGPLARNLPVTLAMIRSSMSSAGAASIPELHAKAELELVSALSIREGQVHDVQVVPGEGAT